MVRWLLPLAVLVVACGGADRSTEPAAETSTSTTVDVAAELDRYRDDVTELVEEAAAADEGDWAEEVITYRALVRSLDDLEPPQAQKADHNRLVVMAEETAALFDQAASACELMTDNNLRRAAGLRPESGDDSCYRYGIEGFEAERALLKEARSL